MIFVNVSLCGTIVYNVGKIDVENKRKNIAFGNKDSTTNEQNGSLGFIDTLHVSSQHTPDCLIRVKKFLPNLWWSTFNCVFKFEPQRMA